LKILILGSQQVMGMARQFFGNKPLLARGKNDGHELYRATLSVVKLKRHQHPFPVDPSALARASLATEAPVVGLGANQQDEIGTRQLVAHPAGPAF
jgi:hypothetical protein